MDIYFPAYTYYLLQLKLLIEKCDEFLCDYLPKSPDSELIDIIYTYDMTLKVDDIMCKLKKNLHLVFIESLEKYVFLKIKSTEFQEILKLREFRAKNEYYIMQAISVWIQYNVEERVGDAELLFSYIDCKACSKFLIFENKNINTGNLILNGIIQQLNLKISLTNEMTTNLMKYYNIDKFNISIQVEKETVIIDTRNVFSLYKVDSDGIYNCVDKNKIFTYNFGEINKVIYIRSYLFCINFITGHMVKFDTSLNIIVNCAFPFEYIHNEKIHHPSISETSDGNLLTIGGFSTICKVYNIDKDVWTEFKSLPYIVRNHATITDGQDIYVLGGYNTNKLLRYRNGEWIEMQPLYKNHSCHHAFLYNKQIFLYGNVGIPEVYNISTDKWTTIDTNIFNDINSDNSVYSEYDRMFYMFSVNNIYSLSLENNTKTLLYENVSVKSNSLVLLDL